MKKSNFHSLRIQIILFTVIVITLSTGVVAATIIYNNYNNTVSQMKSEALSLAYSNAYLISEKAAAAARLSDIQKTLENLVETQSVAYCAIIDEQGTTLAEDDIQHVGESWAEDEDTMIVIKNKQESAEFWIDEDGLKVLDVMIPMNATVEGKKIAVMNIGISVEAMNKALMGSIIKNIVITLMMALVFSLVVLVLVDKKLILPIRRISRVADEIANGDLNASLDMECKGEIGELKESFERITGRIKEQALATQMISRGELNLSFESSSSKDVFSDSLMMLNQTIEEMLTQVHMVIRDIVNGNLNARLDDFFIRASGKN
jgi:Signal transduction histidine kinase